MSGPDVLAGAFNGQLGRIAMFDELFMKVRWDAIVETGTFTGLTTEFFLNRTSVFVHSAELDHERFTLAEERLSKYHRASLYRGDSRKLLEVLALSERFPDTSVFFYLDAHWNDDLPLREEVGLIVSHWRQSIVMIDDFRVPDDDGYGYDCYDQDRTICLEYLKPEISSLPVFFPTLPSSQETGHRRGCVVIGTDEEIGRSLESVKSLRRWPVEPIAIDTTPDSK